VESGIIGVEEAGETEQNLCRCPYCSCVFFSRADLDRHLAAFGNSKEQHEEAHRRTHGSVEYGSAE
jgi:uncharacterized C2H2 Zn-finger protein